MNEKQKTLLFLVAYFIGYVVMFYLSVSLMNIWFKEDTYGGLKPFLFGFMLSSLYPLATFYTMLGEERDNG